MNETRFRVPAGWTRVVRDGVAYDVTEGTVSVPDDLARELKLERVEESAQEPPTDPDQPDTDDAPAEAEGTVSVPDDPKPEPEQKAGKQQPRKGGRR